MRGPDTGGVFATDDHRRVLGHLGLPDDEIAWTGAELFARIAPDVGSALAPDEVAAILEDLKKGRLATRRKDDRWRMTPKGLAQLRAPAETRGEGPAEIKRSEP